MWATEKHDRRFASAKGFALRRARVRRWPAVICFAFLTPLRGGPDPRGRLTGPRRSVSREGLPSGVPVVRPLRVAVNGAETLRLAIGLCGSRKHNPGIGVRVRAGKPVGVTGLAAARLPRPQGWPPALELGAPGYDHCHSAPGFGLPTPAYRPALAFGNDRPDDA